jgi:Flp pilus assembly protein CpaB
MNYRVKNVVLSVGLAALAALLVTFYVTNYKRSVQTAEENVTVYVATAKLEEGMTGASVAERKLFRTEDVPRRSVVPGSISTPDDISDLVVAETVYAGEQISTQRFRTLQEQGIRAELTGNVRAIQISGTADQVLAGTLERGDRVDVVSNIKYNVEQIAKSSGETHGQTDRVATRVVLRDLLVLQATPPTELESQVAPTGGSASVQLALTDAQAQKLFFVVQNGAWTLQLRPVVDAADSPEGVETLESVLLDGLRFKQYRQLYVGRSVQ